MKNINQEGLIEEEATLKTSHLDPVAIETEQVLFIGTFFRLINSLGDNHVKRLK